MQKALLEQNLCAENHPLRTNLEFLLQKYYSVKYCFFLSIDLTSLLFYI